MSHLMLSLIARTRRLAKARRDKALGRRAVKAMAGDFSAPTLYRQCEGCDGTGGPNKSCAACRGTGWRE